jgi:hypothetical protein
MEKMNEKDSSVKLGSASNQNEQDRDSLVVEIPNNKSSNQNFQSNNNNNQSLQDYDSETFNMRNKMSPPSVFLKAGVGDTSTNSNISTDNIQNSIKSNIKKNGEKPMALIEAADSNEMYLIVNTVKNLFPNVNIHVCFNSSCFKEGI